MKKNILIEILIVVVLCITACGKITESSNLEAAIASWQKQYDLGMQYLKDGDYEQAIVAFTAAIEIDPKQEVLYVARADAYVEWGDSESSEMAVEKYQLAIADYEKALDLQSDDKVEKKLDAIQNELNMLSETADSIISDDAAFLELLSSSLRSEQYIDDEEITFFQTPLRGLSLETMRELMIQNDYTNGNQDILQGGSLWGSLSEDRTHIVVYSPNDDSNDWFISYDNTLQNDVDSPDDPYRQQVGIRGIGLNDSLEEVISKLGYENVDTIMNELKQRNFVYISHTDIGNYISFDLVDLEEPLPRKISIRTERYLISFEFSKDGSDKLQTVNIFGDID